MPSTSYKMSNKLILVTAALGMALGLNLLIFNSSLVQAATKDDPTARSGLVQCGNKTDDPCTVEDVFNLFVIATNLLIGTVGLVTILAIVHAGFSMVIAAGNTEGITRAKKKLTNAIIGLILVLLAFILINLILYGIIGVTGNREGVFNPIEYIRGGSTTSVPPSNVPVNKAPAPKPPANGP